MTGRIVLLYAVMAALIVAVGVFQSWIVALTILQLCLISAIMSLGVNIQWGYAGLFNAGIMGFAALGGVAVVLVSMPPVEGALDRRRLEPRPHRPRPRRSRSPPRSSCATGCLPTCARPAGLATVAVGYFVMRIFLDPASAAIEAINPAAAGYLGGLGLPVLISWAVGGLFAAAAAYLVGKVALGLRSDYLAIATLGIAEIILAILKNENWLTRGVKNVTGLPRPIPDERVLQAAPWVQDLAARFDVSATTAAAVVWRLGFALLFTAVLVAIFWLAERALRSPWGRMMRAIRDNRDAAEAMGKDVTRRHLQVFVLGSAVVGVAGAMLVTLDGQFTPGSYNPLRYTFLIWVMVIVGGSGNNWGAVLGGFLIWYVWVMAEPAGGWLMRALTAGMTPGSFWQSHLLAAAPHFRLFLMGLILLLVLRFAPQGLIPERSSRRAH